MSAAAAISKKDISKQPLQHVFRVGGHGLKHGFPKELEGACFLMAPGKDYALPNDFLYGLYLGKFDEYRLLDRPAWMNPGRGDLRPRSMWATAQALATGVDALEARKIGILSVGNFELKLIGRDLLARGVESGIGFVQTTLMNFSQWCSWRNLRGPVNVSYETVVVRMGPRDHARTRELTKVHAIVGQPVTAANYMPADHTEAIIAEVMLSRDGHGPALRTLADTGLRGSEPGSILNRHMPHARDVDPTQPAKFPLWGKGGKKRYPEIPVATMEVVDQYRAGDRRLAVARVLEKGGKEPEELFLKRDGTPITYASLRRAFKKACKKLNFNGRLHWLRHAFAATYLAKAALDMWALRRRTGVIVSLGELNKLTEARQFSLMKILGHKSFATTAIYLEHVHRVLLAKLTAATETIH
jgi:integrase